MTSGVRPTRRPGFRLVRADRQGRTADRSAPSFRISRFSATSFTRASASCCTAPLEYRGSGLQFTNPEYEIVRGEGGDEDDATVHTGRIVPIYEKAGSVTPRMQRTLVRRCSSDCRASLPDPVPAAIRTRRRCPIARRRSLERIFRRRARAIDALNASARRRSSG